MVGEETKRDYSYKNINTILKTFLLVIITSVSLVVVSYCSTFFENDTEACFIE